jgi:hypothetical protein
MYWLSMQCVTRLLRAIIEERTTIEASIYIASALLHKIMRLLLFIHVLLLTPTAAQLLDVSPRLQWECNFLAADCCVEKSCSAVAICDGYCGSVTLQETLLYYGAYASQGMIRRTLSDKVDAREILIATYDRVNRPELALTAQALGLGTVEWYAKNWKQSNAFELFYQWINNELTAGTPVAMGVVWKGSKTKDYDHIVTVKGVATNGLYINDHYDSQTLTVPRSTLPKSFRVKCQSMWCFSKKMYAVALQKPPSVADDRLVRLTVDTNTEPNWTCSSTVPSTVTLTATPAANSLDANQTWYIAKVAQTTSATDLANNNSPFAGTPIECYEVTVAAPTIQVQVQSNEAVFFRLVGVNEGCG